MLPLLGPAFIRSLFSFPRPFFFNFLLFTLSLFFLVPRSFSHLYTFFSPVLFFSTLYSPASRFPTLPRPFFLPPAFSAPFVFFLPLFRSFLVSGSFPSRISSVLFPRRPVPQQSNPFRRPLLFLPSDNFKKKNTDCASERKNAAYCICSVCRIFFDFPGSEQIRRQKLFKKTKTGMDFYPIM